MCRVSVARLRRVRILSDELITAAVDRLEAIDRAAIRIKASMTGIGEEEAAGTIDFRAWSVRLPKTTHVGGMTIAADGKTYGDEDDPLQAGNPLWFIEAFRGAYDVESHGSELDGGHVYRAVLNLREAAQRSKRGIAVPDDAYPESEITAVHDAECTIGPDGVLRRLVFVWEPSKNEMTITPV